MASRDDVMVSWHAIKNKQRERLLRKDEECLHYRYKTSNKGKKRLMESENPGGREHYALRITHHYALQCVEVVSLQPVLSVITRHLHLYCKLKSTYGGGRERKK